MSNSLATRKLLSEKPICGIRILAFSDWRVQSIDELINFVKNLDKKPDIILYGGDDVNRFGGVPKEKIIEEMIEFIKNERGNHGFVAYEAENPALFLWIRGAREKDTNKKIRSILNGLKKKSKNFEFVRLLGSSGSSLILDSIRGHIADLLQLGEDYTIDDILKRVKIEKLDENTILAIFSNVEIEDVINKFEELAKFSKYGLFGIIGNDCLRLDKYILSGENVFDLHESSKEIGDYLFVGNEGASKDTQFALGYVLYHEDEIKRHLKESTGKNKDKKIILLSHSPPKGILDTAIRFSNGENIGSKAIKDFIANNKVILNVCGHVHHMGGKLEQFGNCTVLNIASHDDLGAKGRIAIIDINKEKINVELKELPPSNLEAIYGIGEVYSGILKNAGIKTIKEFAKLAPKEIVNRTNLSPKLIYKWHLHARSLLNEEITLLEKVDLESPVFVDIETDHAQTSVWMICVFDPNKNICKQFTAYKKTEGKKILGEFLDFVSGQGYEKLYCYSGTDFEKRVLLNVISDYKLDKSNFPVFEDLLYLIREVLIVPLTSYKLKELGSFLGFNWRHPDIDGFQAPILYEQFIKTGDRKIIKKLQEYNQDDALVLWHILQKIKQMRVEKSYSIPELQNYL